MAEPRRLLILGGTGEAVRLANRAAELPDVSVISSLAGRTRAPRAPKGDIRIGGFGGTDGLAAYLRGESIDLVIDATHPFADRISENAATACEAAARPLLALRRPEWLREPTDKWVEVDSVGASVAMAESPAPTVAMAESHGPRVFVTVGRTELAPFQKHPELWLLIRLMEPESEPPGIAHGTIIIDRGPFSTEDEIRLMTTHRIDCLVTKNSGGDATYGKIAAARALGLPVIMVRRPSLPKTESVEDIDAAIDWLKARLA
jgi:precorrin-6A/cobalt-precorrin-6A reductase